MTLTAHSPGVFLISEGLATTLTPWELDTELSPPSDDRAISLAHHLLGYSFETTNDEYVSEDGRGRWVGVSRTHFLRELIEAVGPLAEEEATEQDVTASLDPVGDAAMADLQTLHAQDLIVLVTHGDEIVICPTDKLITHLYKKYIVPRVAEIIATVGMTDDLRARRDHVRNRDPYDE